MTIIYNTLSGTSSNYNSIWADSGANINTGKFYVTTTGNGASLSIVDLQHSVVIDNYTLHTAGNSGDFLDSEDIVDININIVGA